MVNYMKATKFFLILVLFISTLSADAMAKVNPRNKSRKPTIGAPLDGGLLIALGAAGAGYYSFRKNKKSKDS
jgi:hypothetical protein